MTPLFSIGVTTWNRKELLKDTIQSLLKQSLGDFEVVVGNDYVQEPLQPADLGIQDARVRILNHSRNLGERENMNEILRQSRGRYFSWLADDDLYASNLLEAVRDAQSRFDQPLCVFPSYRLIFETPPLAPEALSGTSMRQMNGDDFLSGYFSGRVRVIGVAGFFETEWLRREGGVENVAGGRIALCSEYLQILKASRLSRIAYIDAPLVLYRVHDDSWGSTTQDLDLSAEAGRNLLRMGLPLLEGHPHALRHRRGLMRLVADHFIMTAARDSRLPLRKILTQISAIARIGRSGVSAPDSVSTCMAATGLLLGSALPLLKTQFNWRRRRALRRGAQNLRQRLGFRGAS